MQVLTNQRPPSASSHTSAALTPRPTNGSYTTHTPSPSPMGQQQNIINQNGIHNRNGQPQPQQQPQYATPNDQYQNYQPSPSPNVPNSNDGGQLSRPSSVSSNSAPANNNANLCQTSVQPSYTTTNIVQTSSAFTPQTVTSPANFSPNANTNQTFQTNGQTNYQNNGQYQQTNFQQAGNNTSGNAKPGYPPVNNSNPPLVSHNSSGGYPGSNQYGGQESMNNQQSPSKDGNPQWQQPQYSPSKSWTQNWDQQDQFSQPERVNLNSRIKTMILNKQDGKGEMDNGMMGQNRGEENVPTGHFLLHSHHRRQTNNVGGGGAPNWTQNPIPSEPSAIENFMKFATNENNFLPSEEKRNFPVGNKKTEPNRNIMNEMRNFRTENQRELLNRTEGDKKVSNDFNVLDL